MLKNILSLLLLIITFTVSAQTTDSLKKENSIVDTIKAPKSEIAKEKISWLLKDTAKLQSPKKAMIRSAIVPGWGQIGNKKWWKVPLVYGGYVGVGLYYEFNQRYYKKFLRESQARKNGETYYPEYEIASDEQIYSTKDFYRRNRDIAIFGFVAFHTIQVLDAFIDARLATFDVGDNLSIKIRPSLSTPMYAGYAYQTPIPVLKLNIKL